MIRLLVFFFLFCLRSGSGLTEIPAGRPTILVSRRGRRTRSCWSTHASSPSSSSRPIRSGFVRQFRFFGPGPKAGLPSLGFWPIGCLLRGSGLGLGFSLYLLRCLAFCVSSYIRATETPLDRPQWRLAPRPLSIEPSWVARRLLGVDSGTARSTAVGGTGVIVTPPLSRIHDYYHRCCPGNRFPPPPTDPGRFVSAGVCSGVPVFRLQRNLKR